MGILNTSMSLGRVVGPLLGGTLSLFWGIQSATMLALLLCLVGSIYAVLYLVEGRGYLILQASSLTEPKAKPSLSR